MHRKLVNKTQIKLSKAFFLGLGVFVVALLVLALGIFGYALFMQNRIVYGVSINGIDVGGRSLEGARQVLNARLEEFSSKTVLVGAGSDVPASLTDLGTAVLLDDALSNAFIPGHNKVLSVNLREFLAVRRRPVDIPLSLAHDDTKLKSFLLEKFGSTIERPAVNAWVDFDGEKSTVTPAKNGVVVNRAWLERELSERIVAFGRPQFELQVIPDKPAITTTDAEVFARRLDTILATAPYFIFGNGKRFAVSRTQIADWLRVQTREALITEFDEGAIDDYLMSIAPALSRESRNVELGADAIGESSYVSIPSEDALRLNIFSTRERIVASVKNAERSISAMLDKAPAAINEETLKSLHVAHLVGRGVSDFSGSPKNRMQNIRVAAEKYRGLFIGSGEEFSFNAHIGEIDAKSGYVPELVIKEKKLTPEYGGGICQVSTTFFRAAVYAGLKVTQRSNHSIPVRYYGIPGFDATVYPPAPDLKFMNTTSSTLYVQPRIEGTKLTFDLYGTFDNRKVEVEGPKVVEKKPDGSIRTVVVQKVYKNDELVQQKSFWSLYKNPELYKVERNPLE